MNASKRGDVAQHQKWGRQGVQVRTADPLSKSALNGASFDVLSCLVEELGADIDQRDEGGFTALASAAYAGQHHTVRYLVEELGADVNSPDNTGDTPLFLAALRGHLAVLRLLIKFGADINRRNNLGATPLMIASSTESQKVRISANVNSAADISRAVGASDEQTAYLEAKTHCSSPGCSGAGVMKCTGCKQAWYCGETCQLAHWKVHEADCRRWSAERAAEDVI
jgi:hypothetical protein